MLTNIKRRSALLLSVAVVCATVALVPQTASAAAWAPSATGVDAPGNTTALKACPNTSAPAAGFTDTTSTSVDCIKMFGITSGTTATTYSPADPVSRWQMALFLSRMYTPVGLTAGTGTFTAFTDIGGLSSEIQTAINAIAASGVTVGTSAGVYSPNDNVTRAEMAIFLNRMTDIVKDSTGGAIGGDAANGGYNYTDIANQSHEAVLSIIENYDMGIAEDACTAGTCDSTYRPGDDITRLEMAEMMHRLLNHTNARPAGVSIQTPTTAAAAATMTTVISVRNADFTPAANTVVDVMRHTDTVASALDNTAYHALTGLCDTGIVVGTGTECTIDAADAVTNLLGNVAGPSATHAASQTIEWTAWTGNAGAVYVNDTTVANKEVSTLGAAATVVSATTATLTTSARAAAAAYNLSGQANVTDSDGEYTPFGESVTLTMTLTGATAAATADGYSVTFAESRVCDTGNVTISSTPVISSGGTAVYTVAAASDTLPAVVGGAANLGNWCSSEVTITMAGTGTGNTTSNWAPLGHPSSGVSLAGLTSGGYNTSWSDAAAAYTTASDTLAISSNHGIVSTTGTLFDATATAYDQYGRGIAGQSTKFSVGGSGAITATTGANGQAVYTFVACTTNGTVAVATTKDAGEAMSAQGASAPSATSEGTTIYCASAAADGAFGDVAEIREVFTVTMDTSSGTDLGGSTKFSYNGGAVSGTAATFDDDVAGMGTAFDTTTLANDMIECTATANSGDAGTKVSTCTGAAGTGDLATITCTFADLTGTGTESCTIAVTTAGRDGVTSHFVDHDAGDNSLIGKRIITGMHGCGATEGCTSAAVTTYIKYLYGESNAVYQTIPTAAGTGGSGATKAEFVAELAAAAQTDCEIYGSIRNGALTTGVDAFGLGFRADGTTECS